MANLFHDIIDVEILPGFTKSFNHNLGRAPDSTTGRIDIQMITGDMPLEVIQITDELITLRNNGSMINKSKVYLTYYHSIIK